jgi:hypothetical protein
MLLLVCSGAFLARVALLRPHLLAVLLAVLVVWAAARRRLVWLGALALLFPWSYVAFHLTLVLVGLVELARVLAGARPSWQTALVALGGTALGALVHPDFPANVELTWIHVHDILFGAAWGGDVGFHMGGELSPFSTRGLLRYVLLPAGLTALGLWFGWRDRRRDVLPLAAGLAALGFLAMTLKSQRFIEYLVPFAVLAAATALRGRVRETGIAAACALALGTTALVGGSPVRMLASRTDMFPPAIAAAVADEIPPGAQVFTCSWELTGEMMVALPERRFLVALDPVLFFRRDPERYRLWFELVHHPPERPAAIIREEFGAAFVLCEERSAWRPFFFRLSRDPEARLVLRAGPWLVFRVLAGV